MFPGPIAALNPDKRPTASSFIFIFPTYKRHWWQKCKRLASWLTLTLDPVQNIPDRREGGVVKRNEVGLPSSGTNIVVVVRGHGNRRDWLGLQYEIPPSPISPLAFQPNSNQEFKRTAFQLFGPLTLSLDSDCGMQLQGLVRLHLCYESV